MLFFGDEAKADRLRGATIVLPAVSLANVGELALDVLVTSLGPLAHVGSLEDANVMPCVGNDAFDAGPGALPGALSTALELYCLDHEGGPGRAAAGAPSTSDAAPSSSAPLFFLQQRAPAVRGRQAAFASALAGWLQERGVAHVVLLCGLDGGQLRRDQQLQQLEGLQPPGAAGTRYLCQGCELPAALLQPGPERGPGPSPEPWAWVPLEPELAAEDRQLHGLLPPWPLLDALGRQGLPATVLAAFVSEGDNAQDGLRLAGQALELLRGQGAVCRPAGRGVAGLGAGQVLRPPRSWVGLYGRPLVAELF